MSEWTDDDGRPLGEWRVTDEQEWSGIVDRAGGLRALSVFSSLTDPSGVYGAPQIYTAWGVKGADVPLVDIRDYKDAEGITERRVVRRFVADTPHLEGKSS